MRLQLRWFLLFALLLIALLLRLWRIDQVPPGFHFDESFEGLEAWRIFTDATYRPIFLTGNFGVPPLNAYANALTFGLFERLGGEAGPTAMRTTAAILGMLGVLAVYGVAVELQKLAPRGQRSVAFPLWAAGSLALMRWHLHFSRMGIEPIFVPLLWAGATWLLLRGWRTGGWLSFAGCGLLLAASMYAYQGAWIIPLLSAAVGLLLLGQAFLAKRAPIAEEPIPFARRFYGLLITLAVACLVVGPLAWFFWQNPDELLLRPSQIAVVGSGEAASQTTLTQTTWATIAMFWPLGATGDLDPRRNLPGAPALNLWLALPFWLGLGLTFWRIRQKGNAVLLIGLIGLCLPGIFSEYAPHFHRILGATAPTALLCGVGLDWIWQARWPRLAFNGRWLRWSAAGLLLLGGVVSARDYFVRWAALPDLFYAFDTGLWQIGQALAALPAETPVYMTPARADHPTLLFALQTHTKRPLPVSFDGRHIFPATDEQTAQAELYAVIEHEDFRTRLLLPEVFPAATVKQEFFDRQATLYATVYERPAQTVPQRAPQHPLPPAAGTVGDGITLIGYDVQPATLHPGEVLYLHLHWQTTAVPTGDWTVFTHLIQTEADGTVTVLAGHDSQPGAGSLPTTRWQAGWRILDEYQLALPADLPPNRYQLEVGLYGPNGEKLPMPAQRILLGEVEIE